MTRLIGHEDRGVKGHVYKIKLKGSKLKMKRK